MTQNVQDTNVVPRVGLGIFVIDSGSVLLLKRRSDIDTHGAGCWSLPGGKLEPGETMKQSACTELAEEVNVVCDPENLYHIPEFATEDMFYDEVGELHQHFIIHFMLALKHHYANDHGPVNAEPHKYENYVWTPLNNPDLWPRPLFKPLNNLLHNHRSNIIYSRIYTQLIRTTLYD